LTALQFPLLNLYQCRTVSNRIDAMCQKKWRATEHHAVARLTMSIEMLIHVLPSFSLTVLDAAPA